MSTDNEQALKRVLEIVEMFEDENLVMAGDTTLLKLNLRRAGPAELAFTAEEFSLTAEGFIHTGALHAARNIGEMIRKEFELPPRKAA